MKRSANESSSAESEMVASERREIDDESLPVPGQALRDLFISRFSFTKDSPQVVPARIL